uniref:Uncharacterized protein n=1 Tax=Globisporangium ultimum (strain ATCC 200006 / CBS 805.95 / DAOM BR144) TaxID=431595 RepID=K3WT49_GLOUD
MAMLKDLKVAEYNDSTHSLHLYFFDRSTAAKWNKMTIPFRRQLVQLIAAHPAETTGERPKANNVWNRQLGVDGLQNAESRSKYKIQLLNTARSMNMALFLEYLKQTTGKRFYAYPLDAYGPRSHQSQMWENSVQKHLSISTELFGEDEQSSFIMHPSTEWLHV